MHRAPPYAIYTRPLTVTRMVQLLKGRKYRFLLTTHAKGGNRVVQHGTVVPRHHISLSEIAPTESLIIATYNSVTGIISSRFRIFDVEGFHSSQEISDLKIIKHLINEH